MDTITMIERETIALALEGYAEGVQENLEDDDSRDHEAEMDGEPSERGWYPVVEDYMNDAERIRMGEQPLHELTWEVLRDPDSGPGAMTDDPEAFHALVERLLGK